MCNFFQIRMPRKFRLSTHCKNAERKKTRRWDISSLTVSIKRQHVSLPNLCDGQQTQHSAPSSVSSPLLPSYATVISLPIECYWMATAPSLETLQRRLQMSKSLPSGQKNLCMKKWSPISVQQGLLSVHICMCVCV